jgi:hypothetical protein
LVYKSKPDKNGRYKWVKFNDYRKLKSKSRSRKSRSRKSRSRKSISSRKARSKKGSRKSTSRKTNHKSSGNKNYYIHDNRSRPFKVEINGNNIQVFKYITDDAYEEYNKNNYTKLSLELKTDEIFIGKDKNDPKNKGNSILVRKGDEYYYIGDSIYKFKPNDAIIKYVSPVGNNDVPYPYAVGEDNIYLMIENIYFDKYILPQHTDPYEFYYELKRVNRKKSKEPIIKSFKHFKPKIIVKRDIHNMPNIYYKQ